jgi:hypothetical protein
MVRERRQYEDPRHGVGADGLNLSIVGLDAVTRYVQAYDCLSLVVGFYVYLAAA